MRKYLSIIFTLSLCIFWMLLYLQVFEKKKEIILPSTMNAELLEQSTYQFHMKLGPRPKKINILSDIADHKDTATAVLVIACNRKTILRCLNSLLKYRESAEQFPIIVSQGCSHEPTTKLIESVKGEMYLLQPELVYATDKYAVNKSTERYSKGYYKIALHYGWALHQIFFHFNFSSAIIVEDDLEISIDFFEYFLGTLPLLQADTSLMCVSAWNDNGKLGMINIDAPQLLYRTDFFPGLGWMLTKNTWDELSTKWPDKFWDDWIREPQQRKGRACIRPEISRTITFGNKGVSSGQFYKEHLRKIHLNDNFVPFTKLNLKYLLQENYDIDFITTVYSKRVVSKYDLMNEILKTNNSSFQIVYEGKKEFVKIRKTLHLMTDFKKNIARTSYKGIVSTFYKNHRIFLTPKVIRAPHL